jgi:hypothetical protein
MKKLLAIVLAAGGLLAAGSALAWHHGPRVFVGFGFGPAYWGPAPWYPGPYWYPAPLYYPPPVVVAAPPPAPVQYVERPEQPLQSGYWYYCETSRGYYPYVRECATGWKAVPPAPPPAR